MTKILLGPAGTGGKNPDVMRELKELGLDAVEIAFTYGVWMSNADAKEMGKAAKKYRIHLSIHAPYYINLASKEKSKLNASKKRILDSCERAHHLGAQYVVFHAGFYQGMEKEKVYDTIKTAILEMQETIKSKGWKVKLAPETTGKASQFGDLDELLKLKRQTHCHLCVDFAHLKARNNGRIDYDEIFKKIKHIGHIHAHFSGIEYTAKGERRHLITPASQIKELFKYCRKHKANITIINESPDTVGDSIKAKKLLSHLGTH